MPDITKLIKKYGLKAAFLLVSIFIVNAIAAAVNLTFIEQINVGLTVGTFVALFLAAVVEDKVIQPMISKAM